MHANLHSEFLQSVSKPHFSRRTTNTRAVASKYASKPSPTPSVAPKMHGIKEKAEWLAMDMGKHQAVIRNTNEDKFFNKINVRTFRNQKILLYTF